MIALNPRISLGPSHPGSVSNSRSVSGCRVTQCTNEPDASARWTRVPVVVQGAGGSGSLSMDENRNASGQEVNESTREGDNPVGTGTGMGRS